LAMREAGDGWYDCEVEGVGVGARYKFVLPEGLEVPDPASRFQPEDVHGPSEVIDTGSYVWRTANWRGRPWGEIVIYEVHIGAFTSEGTFDAATERLDHLKQLGVTAIQVMPVGDFPGRFGWGNDGVFPYAPDSSYGRPERFMALVDAAHERGISVFLDVVYNHFGPQGNYHPLYAPIFTEHHQTSWGNGINYDSEGSRLIREFIIQNAIYWVTEFRLDGLRLDAVHAINDDSKEHLLHELARRVRAAAYDRHLHLIVENEENDSDLLKRDAEGKVSLFTAQWNDDIHHVLHVMATGERFGYYADYANDSGKIGRALAEGFVFQGEHMPYRGRPRGKLTVDLPPTAFISFIQNHDQIGNRAAGDRMVSYCQTEALEAIAAVYLLSPQIPMLFMGEEWRATAPFPYFCDFDDDLNEKVRKGRRDELSRLPGFDAGDLLDPAKPSTFAVAKLNWPNLASSSGDTVHFYRALLEIRRDRIVPLLTEAGARSGVFRAEGKAVAVDWHLAGGVRLHLLANLSGRATVLTWEPEDAERIFSLGLVENGCLAPWSVIWSLSLA
jgi:malto-oligosyltrehalose trehalohydrolase